MVEFVFIADNEKDFLTNVYLRETNLVEGAIWYWGPINHNLKSNHVVINGDLTAQPFSTPIYIWTSSSITTRHARPRIAHVIRNFCAVNAVNTLQLIA